MIFNFLVKFNKIEFLFSFSFEISALTARLFDGTPETSGVETVELALVSSMALEGGGVFVLTLSKLVPWDSSLGISVLDSRFSSLSSRSVSGPALDEESLESVTEGSSGEAPSLANPFVASS